MIVVKVELWPKGHEEKAVELARVFLANDGTGTAKLGNYDVAVMRRGEKRAPWRYGDGTGATAKPIRTGRVEGHAKAAYPVLRLVVRAIRSMFPEWSEWDVPPEVPSTGEGAFHGKQLSWGEGHAHAKPAPADETVDNDTMIFLGGQRERSFRCQQCGANVFRQLVRDPKRYKCNGCGETYTGDK